MKISLRFYFIDILFCILGRISRPGSGGSVGGGDCYDVPRTPIPIATVINNCDNDILPSYDMPRSTPAPRCESADSYDVPRPLGPSALTPSSSLSSLTTDSMSGSNRSSLAPEYDVPKSRAPTASTPQIQHLQHLQQQATIPPPQHALHHHPLIPQQQLPQQNHQQQLQELQQVDFSSYVFIGLINILKCILVVKIVPRFNCQLYCQITRF